MCVGNVVGKLTIRYFRSMYPSPNILSEVLAGFQGPSFEHLWGTLQVDDAPADGISPAAPGTVGGGAPTPSPQVSAPKSHLIIGDSMVRRAGLRAAGPEWHVETFVPALRTWASLCPVIGGVLRRWVEACRSEGRIPWAVTIWLGGNDVYPRRGPPEPLSAVSRARIRDAVKEAAACATFGVTVLGPVPRPSRDPAVTWEATAAFRNLDRPLCALVRDELADQPVTYVAVGKAACIRRARRRSRGEGGARRNRLSDYFVDPSLYVRDLVHLNADGYRAVGDRFPEGVVVGAAE